jgi:predicted dehydrogenase
MPKSTIIAQIGCGYWGPNLLRAFTSLPDVHVKWVAEMSEARRRFAASQFTKSKTTESIDVILNDPAVDAVVIASPAETHADLAVRFLEAGKHVFVEKPLATTLEDVDRIANASKASGKIVMTGHTFLFNPAVRYVKELLDQGDLGEVYYIYSQRLNLGQVRTDVNAWWNLAPHDISILQYWLNDLTPSEVQATGASYLRNGIEDVVFANLKWSSGVVGHIHVSWLDPQKVRKITIVGSKKMLIYDDAAESKITILDRGYDKIPEIGERMDFDLPNPTALAKRSGDILMPSIKWKEPLKTEAEHFIECITEGSEPITGIDHARKVVEILLRADCSMKAGG